MSAIRILIVEDDPVIAADLQDRFKEAGYQVLGPVAAGETALGYFTTKDLPDLLLLDVQLEGDWDGIETSRRIREKHDLPIIFLTSNSDDGTFRQVSAVNPQAFLSKPFRSRDLNHSIELAIQQSAKKKGREDHTSNGDNAFLVTKTLKKFADDLSARPEFMRVHRS